jgi:hypothetical protein
MMKKITFTIFLLAAITRLANAQTNQNPTTLYEWNSGDTGTSPGERVIAYINSGTIGTYTGGSFAGQIIDGNANWGYVLPTVANFTLSINFSGSSYLLTQDVVTNSVTLQLKYVSATQVALVANCPKNYKQARVLFRYTNGNIPSITPGSSSVATVGTVLLSQPTYTNALTGRLAINVTNNAKASAYTLAVGGKAIAEAVTVQLQGAWPDYVFKKDYTLPLLTDVKTYIDQNQHLPEIPSAQQIEKDGVNLGEMNKLLLKKVEELTLYLIESNKNLIESNKKQTEQEERMKKMEQQLELLTKREKQ